MPLKVPTTRLFSPCSSTQAPIFHQTFLAEQKIEDEDEITKDVKAQVT